MLRVEKNVPTSNVYLSALGVVSNLGIQKLRVFFLLQLKCLSCHLFKPLLSCTLTYIFLTSECCLGIRKLIFEGACLVNPFLLSQLLSLPTPIPGHDKTWLERLLNE